MVVDTSNRAQKHNAAIAKQLNVYGKKNCMLNVGTNTTDDEVYLFMAGAATWLRQLIRYA